MKSISARAINRDLAWNLIMFSSYSAKVLGPSTKDTKGKLFPGGTLEFYAAANADILFGGIPIVSANFANANQGVCDPKYLTASFDAGRKSFNFDFELCDTGYCDPYDNSPGFKYEYIKKCPNWYSGNTDDGVTAGYANSPGSSYGSKANPTIKLNNKKFQDNHIFDPSQFGYRYGKVKSNTMSLQVDSRSLSLALAVNYGMLLISDLVKVERNAKLTSLLTNLAKQNQITIAQANTIFSFYDPKQLPMDHIYCMISEKAALPAAGGLPSFNGGADDDAQFGDGNNDDDAFLINFGGASKDINGIPADLAVSLLFVIKDYDFSKLLIVNDRSNDIAKLENAIRDAWAASNIPVSSGAHRSKVTDAKIWWVNSDSTTNTASSAPGFLPYTRRLSSPTGPITTITYGFKWNPNSSGKSTLYEALDFLVQTVVDSDFFSQLDTKLNSANLNLAALSNTPTSSKYDFFIDDFYVKPKNTVDDDYVKSHSSQDDYFGDDGGGAPTGDDGYYRRELSDSDPDSTLKRVLRERIDEVGTMNQVENHRLLKTKPKIPKVNKDSGATCFVKVGDTFMLPVASHFGQAGSTKCKCKKLNIDKFTTTPSTPKYVDDPDCYSVDKMGASPTGNIIDSTLCPTVPEFPFLPADCNSPGAKDKMACKYVNINIGLIFYPFKADPREVLSPKPTVKANGQIFALGMKAQNLIKNDPTSGDLTFIKSALNAMGMVNSATEDYTYLANGNVGSPDSDCTSSDIIPTSSSPANLPTDAYKTSCTGKLYMTKYSTDRWKKAFNDLCGPTKCSILYFRLSDDTQNPVMNMYSYVAPKSASNNQIIYDEKIIDELKSKLPTQLNEQYYQCVQTVFQSIITGIGVGKSNADVFGAVAVTVTIIIILQLMKRSGKKLKTKQEKDEDHLAAVAYRQDKITEAIQLLIESNQGKGSNGDKLQKCIEAVRKIDEGNYEVEWEEISEGYSEKPKGFLLEK